MSELPDPPPAEPSAFHKDRREGGGLPLRPNDDQLAELAEEERVDAGVDPYEPDEVPPATDDPVPTDVTTPSSTRRKEKRSSGRRPRGSCPRSRAPSRRPATTSSGDFPAQTSNSAARSSSTIRTSLPRVCPCSTWRCASAAFS